MSPARRRRRPHGEEEAENTERWTVSYMDMVTVMMCLFIVLFAISQVDQQKFYALRNSLSAGFGVPSGTNLEVLDGGTSVLTSDAVAPDAPDITNQSGGPVSGAEEAGTLHAAHEEVAELLELRDTMAADLQDAGLGEEVIFSVTDRGLVIGLVTQNVFFSPASADMTPTTEDVIDILGGTLAVIDNELATEGHANVLPRTEPYPTNWELSADRATKVLRRLVEHGGVAPARAHAVGFGDAHPLVTEGPDALDLNRRVDVVVLSDAPEDVRELLPEVATAMEGA